MLQCHHEIDAGCTLVPPRNLDEAEHHNGQARCHVCGQWITLLVRAGGCDHRPGFLDSTLMRRWDDGRTQCSVCGLVIDG